MPPTRETLHRIAAHILARRRYEVAGRFGLRVAPGGMATPAFGDAPETVRISGGSLVREVAGQAAYRRIAGSTLRELAVFAGTDIAKDFQCGPDTPDVGDADRPLELDVDAARQLADWYTFGGQVLDAVVASCPETAAPETIQLWPEHFDAGTNVGLANGERVNLGVSPGDGFSDEPYLYIGPWGPGRPGDARFWNAPFGAVLRRSDIGGASDRGVEFFQTGLRRLSG